MEFHIVRIQTINQRNNIKIKTYVSTHIFIKKYFKFKFAIHLNNYIVHTPNFMDSKFSTSR